MPAHAPVGGSTARSGCFWTSVSESRYHRMMDMPPEFVPLEHKDLLRQWTETVYTMEVLAPAQLALDMRRWLKQQEPKWEDRHILSESLLKRFRDPDDKATGARSGKKLRGLWLFLWAHYRKHKPGGASEDGSEPPDAAHPKLLSLTLEKFFEQRSRDARDEKSERLQSVLAGRYVLYQQDYEMAAGSMAPHKRIRASLIEIEPIDNYLQVKETQHFEALDRATRHQVDCGVLYSCGPFVVGIMAAETPASFKCMVIDTIFPRPEHGKPARGFLGKVLIAASFDNESRCLPSSKFVCMRAEGEEQHGLYEYEDIDRMVMFHFTTPSFHPMYEFVF